MFTADQHFCGKSCTLHRQAGKQETQHSKTYSLVVCHIFITYSLIARYIYSITYSLFARYIYSITYSLFARYIYFITYSLVICQVHLLQDRSSSQRSWQLLNSIEGHVQHSQACRHDAWESKKALGTLTHVAGSSLFSMCTYTHKHSQYRVVPSLLARVPDKPHMPQQVENNMLASPMQIKWGGFILQPTQATQKPAFQIGLIYQLTQYTEVTGQAAELPVILSVSHTNWWSPRFQPTSRDGRYLVEAGIEDDQILKWKQVGC